jgi:hypothetical protein
MQVTGLRYFLQATCIALLIGGPLIAAAPTRSPSTQSGPSREQPAKLREAERTVESIMNRVHQTYDFGPVLIDLCAPEMVKAWRESLKAGPDTPSDREILQMYSATITILYVSELWRASLEMNGIRVDSADKLPPGIKAISQEFDETESRLQGRAATPADLQEILEKLEKLRKAMVQQIRPDVFTSEAYRKYLEENHRDSQVSGPSSPGEETSYEVWREGLGFTMVERAGAMKILWVHQAWMESRIEPQPEVGRHARGAY